VSIIAGAYFAAQLTQAKLRGRIGRVGADSLLTIKIFCDIGGTGSRSDAFVMWALQFVGREIRALDYYEQNGQPIGTHLEWLRKRGYEPARAQIWLPHDGDTADKVQDTSYASAFRTAGYHVEVVPNQGKGAAKQRIEAARRWFPSTWFNSPPDVTYTDGEPDQPTCAGLEALGWYHERKDEQREIGLGPEHDWSSHGSDAFGLGCVCADRIFKELDRDSGERIDPNKGFRRAI
jgi:phage terminase large subunit